MKLFSLFDFLSRKRALDPVKVSTADAEEAYLDFALRRLAFDVCVNLIANAIGNCEFQTLIKGVPEKRAEYYTLNIEPNSKQNSSVFWHDFIYKLYRTNEVLVISKVHSSAREELIIADSFDSTDTWPKRENEYKNVCVDNTEFKNKFSESEVLHFILNDENVKAVVDMLYISYYKLIQSSETAFSWSNGKHFKVHVEQTTSGKDGWTNTFQQMINDMVRPFLKGENGVLPEFDGYKYENLGSDFNSNKSTRDIRALYDDIFDYTARAFGIPPVLVKGDVADSKDAFNRWLTTCIDPLAAQIEEELNRKRYGYKQWKKGNSVHINTSTLIHFDMFSNASNIEKLVGSGTFSINDILVAAGQAPINEDWAKAHYLTKNISALTDAVQKITNINGEEGENGK